MHVLGTAGDILNLINVLNHAFYELLDLHAQSKKLYMIYLYCKQSIIKLFRCTSGFAKSICE